MREPSTLLKKLATFLSILFFSIGLIAQNQSILETAIRLKPFVRSTEDGAWEFKDDVASVEQYLPILLQELNLENIDPNRVLSILADTLAGNPFIGDEEVKIYLAEMQASTVLAGMNLLNSKMVNRSQRLASGPETAYTSAAAPSTFVTNAVDGFSRWLVKRTKQEIALTFFTKFRESIQNQKDLHLLFKKTGGLLNVIDSDIYQYDAYLKSLRESFIYDFKLIPYNLASWADSTNFIKKDQTMFRFILKETLEIPPMILDGKKPNEIIARIAKIKPPQQNQDLENVLGAFKAVDMISNSLLNPNQDFNRKIWYEPNTWASEVDDLTMYLYLGLLWEKTEGISVATNDFNTKLLLPIATDLTNQRLNKFSDFVYRFLDKGTESFDLLNRLRDEKPDSAKINYLNFHSYNRTILDFIKIGDEFRQEFLSGQPSNTFNEMVDLMDHTNNLIFHVRQENYLQGATELSSMIERFYTDENQFGEFKQNYFKYITFMATMADAQTPNEIELAFDIFALPAGSSKTKKKSPVSVALNAYVGLSYGVEQLEKSGNKRVFAMSAPVGVNVNWGLNKKGSLSLFGSVLDLGAVTAFRFNDNTSTLPELTLQNLFAPGAYLVYGFGRNIPFALSVGAQAGPNTRKIEVVDPQNPEVVNRDSGWRWGASLSVDIPVFHFYTKGRKWKKKGKKKK